MTTKTRSTKAPTAPRTTKKAQLIRMLSGKAGADAGAISKKLGWLPHTTRAAITELKKAGYEVATEKPDPNSLTHYRIIAWPAPLDASTENAPTLQAANAG